LGFSWAGTVTISPYWGVGANILEDWTYTVVDAPHIDIPGPFQPLLRGDTYRLGVVEQNVSGYRLGASATMVTGNAFDANDFSIFVDAGAGIVMQCNQIQGHQNSPSGMSTAGIHLRGLNAGVIQANVITGGHALGGIYLENGGSQWNNVVQANTVQESLAVTGWYSNRRDHSRTGAMGMLPRWLVPGLTVVAIGGFSVPAGTTVQLVSGNTITLSHPISGTAVTDQGFSFNDASGKQVGGVSLG
jgi:hypothetical protein